MELDLIEVARPHGEEYWYPFDHATTEAGFDQFWWSDGPVYLDSDSVYFKVVDCEREIARIQLTGNVEISHYGDTPLLGSLAYEIALFEVHADCRRQGLGTRAIKLLLERHRQYRFFAFSEGADEFWASLGWTRHLHGDQDDSDSWRSLYIQRAVD